MLDFSKDRDYIGAMAKKLTSIFLIVDARDIVIGFEKTLAFAKSRANSDELDDCKIYEVTKAYSGWYPQEPDIEFSEVKLEDL